MATTARRIGRDDWRLIDPIDEFDLGDAACYLAGFHPFDYRRDDSAEAAEVSKWRQLLGARWEEMGGRDNGHRAYNDISRSYYHVKATRYFIGRSRLRAWFDANPQVGRPALLFEDAREADEQPEQPTERADEELDWALDPRREKTYLTLIASLALRALGDDNAFDEQKGAASKIAQIVDDAKLQLSAKVILSYLRAARKHRDSQLREVERLAERIDEDRRSQS